MTEPAPTHVEMCHAESGGSALFPVGAVELWRLRGWVPADETPPADVPPPADEPTDNRPAARKRATDSQE